MKITGFIILILGIALTIFTSLEFFTKEKVVDLGSIEITKNKPHNFSWSPVIGIAMIGLGGVVILLASKNK